MEAADAERSCSLSHTGNHHAEGRHASNNRIGICSRCVEVTGRPLSMVCPKRPPRHAHISRPSDGTRAEPRSWARPFRRTPGAPPALSHLFISLSLSIYIYIYTYTHTILLYDYQALYSMYHMLRYSMLCYARLCRIMLRYIMLRHAYYDILYRIILC